MNLTEDFVNIQGILLSVEKSVGSLAKIKYRGGNEKNILSVISEIHKHFVSKKYIVNNEIDLTFRKELEDICLFFILNTELKVPLNEPSFEHLINITPQISTCLLANLITGLNLSSQFCNAIERLGSNVAEELIAEVIPCIRKCKPKDHLMNAINYLNLIVAQVAILNNEEEIDQLNVAAGQIILHLDGISGKELEGSKIDTIYESMGLTLFYSLELLLICKARNKSNLATISQQLINLCSSIIMAVTIDVFCCWAEVQHNGKVLQTVIAETAYNFIEKYGKHTAAKELISMLGNIAQKPLSLAEQIHRSDISTIISIIDRADSNQKQWFTALMNTQVLKSKGSVDCLARWTHLCSLEDISRLLLLSTSSNDEQAKKIVIKCAATLEFPKLVIATTRHFYKSGTNSLIGDIQTQLTLLFNKIKDKNIEEEFSKELFLLLLQNYEQSLSYIFEECGKCGFYSTNLGDFWNAIKEIIAIDDSVLKILKQQLSHRQLNEQNSANYLQLLNIFIEKDIFISSKVAAELLAPLIGDTFNGQDYQNLSVFLEMLKDLRGNIFQNNSRSWLNTIFEIMSDCRCNFLKFDATKQTIVTHCVGIFEKYRDCGNDEDLIVPADDEEPDIFISFYKTRWNKGVVKMEIISHFIPINFDNYAETVAHLIKILPRCVTPEWFFISTDLITTCGVEKAIELLCDTLLFLCDLLNSQETKTEEVKCMFNCLGYCLQNLAIVIKDCVQPKLDNQESEIVLTRNVCRLLKEIPIGSLKNEEGLKLASLLSDGSLRALRSDKKFACLVAAINENRICKMLATKILSL